MAMEQQLEHCKMRMRDAAVAFHEAAWSEHKEVHAPQPPLLPRQRQRPASAGTSRPGVKYSLPRFRPTPTKAFPLPPEMRDNVTVEALGSSGHVNRVRVVREAADSMESATNIINLLLGPWDGSSSRVLADEGNWMLINSLRDLAEFLHICALRRRRNIGSAALTQPHAQDALHAALVGRSLRRSFCNAILMQRVLVAFRDAARHRFLTNQLESARTAGQIRREFALEMKALVYNVAVAIHCFMAWSRAAALAHCDQYLEASHARDKIKQKVVTQILCQAQRVQLRAWLHKWSAAVVMSRQSGILEKAQKLVSDSGGIAFQRQELLEIAEQRASQKAESALCQVKHRIRTTMTTVLLQGFLSWRLACREAVYERECAEEKIRIRQSTCSTRSKAVHLAALLANDYANAALPKQCVGAWSAIVRARRTNKMHRRMCLRATHMSMGALQSQCLTKWASLVGEAKRTRLVDLAAQRVGVLNQRAHQQKLAAIQRSLDASGRAMLLVCFGKWRDIYDAAQLDKQRKQQTMSVALRGIANAEGVLQSMCFSGWSQILSEVRSKQQLKSERMMQAVRGIAASDEALRSQCFVLWARVMSDAKHAQSMVDAEHAARVTSERARDQKMMAVQRALATSADALLLTSLGGWRGVANKKKQSTCFALRSMANSESALLAECLALWSGIARDAKCSRATKQEVAQAAARGRERTLAALRRTFAASEEMLVLVHFREWHDCYESVRLAQIKKKHNMSRAIALISSSSQALLAHVFSLWSHETSESKQQRRLEAVREQTQMIRSEAHRKRLMALERSFAQSGRALVLASLGGWQSVFQANKLFKDKKTQAMSQVLRSISSSEQMLLLQCADAWNHVAQDAKCVRLARESQKKGAMSNALRTIANSEQALLSQCFLALNDMVRDAKFGRCQQQIGAVRAAQEQMVGARQRALIAFERSLASSAQAMCLVCLGGWRDVVKADRLRNSIATQGIAVSAEAMQSQCLVFWFRFICDAKHDRELLAASEKDKRKKMEALERSFLQSEQSFLLACFSSWHSSSKSSHLCKTKKGQTMSRILREISSAATLLQSQSFSAWNSLATDERRQRLLQAACGQAQSAQASLQSVAQAQRSALMALERSLKSSLQSLTSGCLVAWAKVAVAARSEAQRRIRAKGLAMAQASRFITSAEHSLQEGCVLAWLQTMRESKGQERRSHCLALLRSTVAKLREQVSRQQVLAAWRLARLYAEHLKRCEELKEELKELKARPPEPAPAPPPAPTFHLCQWCYNNAPLPQQTAWPISHVPSVPSIQHLTSVPMELLPAPVAVLQHGSSSAASSAKMPSLH